MTAHKQTPTLSELEAMVRTNEEFGAAARYQELAKSPEDVPADTLRELAEQMTSPEAVELLTGTVERILTNGTHSEQRPGILYKIFEENPKEGLPRITVERDSMTGDSGQGDHIKVSFDYPHVSTIEGTALREPAYTGDDYEWRQGGDSVRHFERYSNTEPRVDPSGDIRLRAADPTYKGSSVFNNSPVREIYSTTIEENYPLLELAELLRRREEGRERTKSQIDAEIDAHRAERAVTQDRRNRSKKFGQGVLDAVGKLFRRGRR